MDTNDFKESWQRMGEQKNRAESAVSGWKMQTECHTKKTGTGNLSVKVHGTGRTAVKADLEI